MTTIRDQAKAKIRPMRMGQQQTHKQQEIHVKTRIANEVPQAAADARELAKLGIAVTPIAVQTVGEPWDVWSQT